MRIRKQGKFDAAKARFWNEVWDDIHWGDGFGDVAVELNKLCAKVVIETKKQVASHPLDRLRENRIMKDIIAGLTIFTAYQDCYMAAEHSMIYAGARDISTEDSAKLEEMHWRKDPDDKDLWYHFV